MIMSVLVSWSGVRTQVCPSSSTDLCQLLSGLLSHMRPDLKGKDCKGLGKDLAKSGFKSKRFLAWLSGDLNLTCRFL